MHSEKVTCGPCSGNCQQGRTCPARAAIGSPLSDRTQGEGHVAKRDSSGLNARKSTGYAQGWRDSALLICVFVLAGSISGLVSAVLEMTS